MADGDAAATAVLCALGAANPARAAEAVDRYDRDRRAAAHHNSDAVGAALAHLKPRSRTAKLCRRAAGLLAPAVPSLGSWLEHAAYGPRTAPPSNLHGRY
jgi:3-(3-hydroxy-phenyl)propionate hydroxylase